MLRYYYHPTNRTLPFLRYSRPFVHSMLHAVSYPPFAARAITRQGSRWHRLGLLVKFFLSARRMLLSRQRRLGLLLELVVLHQKRKSPGRTLRLEPCRSRRALAVQDALLLPSICGERLFAVHGLSERTTVQTSSLLLRLFFFTSWPTRPISLTLTQTPTPADRVVPIHSWRPLGHSTVWADFVCVSGSVLYLVRTHSKK